MCEYCDKRKKRDYLFNNPVLAIKILSGDYNYLAIKSYNHESKIINNVQIINYCPMCGRKL